MAKQRDPVLDSMRGIGIVLMVLGHSGFPGTDYIYLFHMALFFMLSGWFFSLRGGLVHFVRRKLLTLWLPFVAANTVFTVCNNLFLRLNILTADARIAEIPGNSVTAPVSIKDIIGRTVHWCVFDGGTQLGGAMWFIQALFQISLLYAVIEVLLQKLLHGGDTLIPQGLLSGVLLWAGWHCNQIGWNVWGLGIAASCYWMFYLGTVLRRTARSEVRPLYRAAAGAAAFVLLLVLRRLGSVGLAGNGYTNPAFLLLASMAGWVLVRSAACLTAPLPRVSAVLGYLGRATMPIVILHFLSFKLVTWLGLLATGGESYLLAAFPVYFTGGVWWLAYTAAGLALPLAADAVYKKIKNAVLAHRCKKGAPRGSFFLPPSARQTPPIRGRWRLRQRGAVPRRGGGREPCLRSKLRVSAISLPHRLRAEPPRRGNQENA